MPPIVGTRCGLASVGRRKSWRNSNNSRSSTPSSHRRSASPHLGASICASNSTPQPLMLGTSTTTCNSSVRKRFPGESRRAAESSMSQTTPSAGATRSSSKLATAGSSTSPRTPPALRRSASACRRRPSPAARRSRAPPASRIRATVMLAWIAAPGGIPGGSGSALSVICALWVVGAKGVGVSAWTASTAPMRRRWACRSAACIPTWAPSDPSQTTL
mmetsp:Transcript_29228/g.97025  ORF Transcript_29228/g.97025 Transcript_29228/m.97025 type:complete len:217 (+) Transcript_29228:1893-2543(+)